MSTFAPLNQEITELDGTPIVAPSTTAIIPAFLPDGTVQDKFAALVQQPSILCNTGLALTLVVTDGDSSITSAWARVKGYDMFGRRVDAMKSTNVAGSATYDFEEVFYSIDFIEAQGVDFTGGDLLSLGVRSAFGVPRVLTSLDEVLSCRIDGTPETVASVISLTYNRYTPSAAANGARRFYMNFLGD